MFHGSSESYRGFKRIKTACYSLIHLAISKYLAKGLITVTAALAEELGISSFVVHNVAAAVPSEGESVLQDRPAVVCVGRLVRVKRFDRAISALAELGPKEATLYLIGDGPERRNLEELVSSMGLEARVRFLGFLPDARAVIADSDLLLLTSESEGLPTVVLEAMLSGIPIVATDLPGLREIKQRFPGYPLFLVKEITAFPDKIREGLKQQRVANQPEIIEYLSPMRAARQFREVVI
jgi:glycosyltransferase involved in cell wall biosynthesis